MKYCARYINQSYHKLFTTAYIMLAAIILLFSSGPLHAALTASVDRSQISEDETLKLTVSSDDRNVQGQPNVSALDKDFDVLNQKSSSQTQIINGKISSSRSWTYVLGPKRSGRLQIPAFTLGNDSSRGITVFVTKAGTGSASGSEDLFIEAAVSQRELYVQEELIFIFRIYTAVNWSSASLEPLAVDNALVEEPKDAQYNKEVNGKYYQVIEKRYIIHPQESGEIVIPPLTLSARVQDTRRSIFDDGRLLRKRSEEFRIKVNPPDPAFAGNIWLPAKDLRLTDAFSGDPEQVTVGDSLTRNITITAEGLLAAQLPAVEAGSVAGLKIYPDKASLDNREVGGTLLGQRVETMAIIPTRPGSYTLPAITIGWWNTEDNMMEWSTLPERTITAIAAQDNSQISVPERPLSTELPSEPLNEEPPTSSANTEALAQAAPAARKTLRYWQAATAIFALLWLLTLVLYWRKPRATNTPRSGRQSDAIDENKAYREAVKALKGQQAMTARSAVINWAQVFYNKPQLQTLAQIAYLLPEAKPSLLALDEACFGKGDMPNTDALSAAIDQQRAKRKAGSNSALPPLYPA